MTTLLKKLALLALVLGFFTQANASELYVFVNDTILKAKDGKSAKLFLGVPVTVKKDNGKDVDVSVQGYLDGLNVYSSKAKELLIATVDKDFKMKSKAGNQVELEGSIEKESLVEDSSEVWEEHEEFFFEMCTQCHAAPKVPHHTMIEWEALFGAMKGFAKLDDEESDYLLRYLKSNASNGLIKAKH